MEYTRINTQVSVKHCSLCQGDTEYYCYGCRQDLCIQCKELHVIDLSTKNHEVTCYIERMKYPPIDKSEESGDPNSRDPSKQVKSVRSGNSEQVMSVRSRDPAPLSVWLSPSERSEMERRLYSKTIYSLRGETIYNRLVMLKGVRQDLKTVHKAVTIRGLSMAEMIGQVPKDKIDEVLAGDLEDRCLVQKTRMTRHMTRLLQYVHRYEQLYDIMVKQPIKFLRIMTRKHNYLKIQEILHTKKDQDKLLTQRGKKEMDNMVVSLMKGMRLVETGKRQEPGTELLLTMMSSPVLQKSLSVTGVQCGHISCVTPDRVWVSDDSNLILTDTATGKQLHSVEHPLNLLFSSGIHTVNCDSELIYIDEDKNINKPSSDMKTTATLIEHTDTTWKPRCVYCLPSSGDLLVGMWRRDTSTDTGKVMRYDNTGKHKQTIPNNDNTPHTLYEWPCYLTENNNGDVLVSDWDRVVVTSGEGVHRFSYTGPPSGSRLEPRGICTDVMSHILTTENTVTSHSALNHSTVSTFPDLLRRSLTDRRRNKDSGRRNEDSGRRNEDSGRRRRNEDSGRMRRNEDSGRRRNEDSGRRRNEDSGRRNEDSGRRNEDSGRRNEDSGMSRNEDSGRSRNEDSGRRNEDSWRRRDEDSGRRRNEDRRRRLQEEDERKEDNELDKRNMTQ
uniref:Uncharacterized protein LOC111133278 isoform X3 n=1 Tax=Crassostrea virginica TaxID=6565 RepID=A0A8B8EAQ6_CRAVI|nr:uncharacterized protein LOC111133278 isoform X3 [Crassostrea virginica]